MRVAAWRYRPRHFPTKATCPNGTWQPYARSLCDFPRSWGLPPRAVPPFRAMAAADRFLPRSSGLVGFNSPRSDVHHQLSGLRDFPSAFARRRHHLFRLSKLSKFPQAKTMKRNPALERASVRIVSLAMPKSSCAMVPKRTATVAAVVNDKMWMIMRPMQAQ
jgi:hypothetical protein